MSLIQGLQAGRGLRCLRVLLSLVICACVAPCLNAHAALLTWNNGSGDSQWNATSTNWGGATLWNNATPDSAVFGATGIGTVSLGTAITANSLTFNNAGYVITGNTLTLGGTTPTILNNANATISSVLAGNAGLVVAGSVITNTYSSYLPSTPTTVTVFSGSLLANISSPAGVMGGTSFNAGIPRSATTYFFVNNGTVATFQLQALDGTYVKCVKVQLRQSGADILGTVLYAKYIVGAQYLGQSFDSMGTSTSIATAATAGGYGAASISVLGAGSTLTLAGSNTYSGATTVNFGQLAGVTGSGCANSAVTVNSGANNGLSVLINSNTRQWTCAGLTFGSGATALDFNFGSVVPSSVLAPLQVNGDVAFTGTPTVTVEVTGISPGVSTYPLMTWTGSLSGTPPLAAIFSLPHSSGGLSVAGHTLYLTVTNTEPLRWALPGDGTWNVNTSVNWKDNTGAETTYRETAQVGDQVVLDETYLSGPANITLTNFVYPQGVIVANTTYGYTLSGGGGIGGSTSLIKQGAGTLTIGNRFNGFTGNVVVSGGTLALGTNGNVANGPLGVANTAVTAVTIASGATMDKNGFDVDNYGYTIAGTGTGGQGALINSGPNTAGNHLQNPAIALSDDASIGGSGNFYMIADSYKPSTLDLRGHTLTKSGANTFYIANTTVTAGKVNIVQGAISVYRASDASAAAFSLADSGGVALVLSQNLAIGSLTGGGDNDGQVSLHADLTVGADNSSPPPFTGVISGTGNLIKTGTGTLTLSGMDISTGTTTVSNGTLAVNSRISGPVQVQRGGTLAVGTAVDPAATLGTLALGSSLAFKAGSTVFMRISKTGGTPASDLINGASGVLNYAGTLAVTNITSDSKPLAQGDSFTLFTGFGRYNGSFDGYVLPPLPVGLSWDISQLAMSGAITVANGAGAPFFSLTAGGYIGAQTVAISSTTAGATIYYTMDGSTPTTSSPVYSGPVTVPVNTTLTIKAIATAPGYASSGIASATYVTRTEAVWATAGGGTWSDSYNWTDYALPNGHDVTADFSRLTLSSPAIVTLDGSWTIGQLIFGDMGSNYTWGIDPGSGGTLTLAATNTPAITVLNEQTTITAAVVGTNGLVKKGAGTLTLSGANTYTGNTVVNGGTLELAGNIGIMNTSAVGYTVNANSILQVDNAANQWNVGQLTTINVNGGGELRWKSTAGDANSPYLNTVNLDSSDGAAAIVNTTAGNSDPRFGYGINGLITSSGANVANQWIGGLILLNKSGSGQTLTISNTAPLWISGAIRDYPAYTGTPVSKKGAGTLVLAGTNTYSGATTIGNGAVFVTGSIGSSALTVQNNAVLGGSGLIRGTVTLQTGGIIQGGDANYASRLTTVSLKLGVNNTDVTYSRFTLAAGGSIAATNALMVNGTHIINVLDPTLTVGTNTLFTYAGGLVGGSSGSAGFRLGMLPALPDGATAHLLDTGSAVQLVVVVVPTVPPVLTNSISGNTLTLSWPTDHLFYRLEVQTNSLGVGLGTNWFTWPGSMNVTTVPIPIDPKQPAVFFRLVYP